MTTQPEESKEKWKPGTEYKESHLQKQIFGK